MIWNKDACKKMSGSAVKFFCLLYVIAVSAVLSSCGRSSASKEFSEAECADSYAGLLRINDYDGYSVVDVRDPHDSDKLLHRYVLVPSDLDIPENLPSGVILRTPVKNMIVYSSVHAGALKELGAVSLVGGVADAMYFKIPEIKEGLESGRVVDVGNASSPSIEKMVAARPSAILFSIYDGMDIKGIDKTGIPMLQFAENMEDSPLGRAEWIRFLGRLAGKGERADSIFAGVVRDYIRLRDGVADSCHPRVLTETMYDGVWYAAAADSYQARLIKDAGGEYVFSAHPGNGSVSLSFEQVLAEGKNADIWLVNVYDKELDRKELDRMDPRYRHFNPYRTGQIYYCNTLRCPLYEETPFHPELLLKDYISLFSGKNKDNCRYFSILRD